jgi:hypothetical protein
MGKGLIILGQIRQGLKRGALPICLLLAGGLGAYLCIELGNWLILNHSQPWPFFMNFELLDWIEDVS